MVAKANIALILVVLLGCRPGINSPFSDELQQSERFINQNAIQRLSQVEEDGKIRFILFSDSHQSYTELRQMITLINDEPQVDFVAGLGDFTNSGYNFEYDEFIRHFSSIKFPAVTTIGNHDSLGAGPELFKKAFGELNFFFESANYRFIFFNSANLENPADFDPQWLTEKINESVKNILLFSHADLRDEERFSGETATAFDSVIKNPKVKVIFYGHDHDFSRQTDNGTIMIRCGSVKQAGLSAHWILLDLDIVGSQLCAKVSSTGETFCYTLK